MRFISYLTIAVTCFFRWLVPVQAFMQGMSVRSSIRSREIRSTDNKEAVDLFTTCVAIDSPEVSRFEADAGYVVEKKWFLDAARKLQFVVKKQKFSFDHGRIIYTSLRKYLEKADNDKPLNLIDVGTARGFSALCAAKALEDTGVSHARVITIDPLSHFERIEWVTIDRIDSGVLGLHSRADLISPWSQLFSKYVIFLQGYSKIVLPSLQLDRINFAFIDGMHDYSSVYFEFEYIAKSQIIGDLVVFDDFDRENFPGLVKAVQEIAHQYQYSLTEINGYQSRNYMIAIKVSN